MRTTSTDTPGDLPPRQHLRVSMFGRFQIEWLDPQTGQVTPLPPERLHGQNAGSALGLFKALLSCPDRFATRSWLNEQFWPDSTVKRAEERLNDVVSSLRTLLRPKGSTKMLVHFVYGTSGRGAGFRLDSYPQLWCDADAFEWHVKHALLLDQREQDSTACWEHASVLAERGMYLPEQIEEDWSRPRRDYLNGLARDCVHRWTAILRQMGHVDEVILRLRSYWLEHPTDEDALRSLIDLLGECGRFSEAEECYTKARAVLAEENHALDDRSIDAMEVVRALKVQQPHVQGFRKKPDRPGIASPSFFYLQNSTTFLTSSQVVSPGIMETLNTYGGQDVQSMIRRQFLQQFFGLVGMPFVLQTGLVSELSSSRAFDSLLSQCEANILACWQLMRGRNFLATQSLLVHGSASPRVVYMVNTLPW